MAARYEVGIDSPVIYHLGRELTRSYDKASQEVTLTDEELADYRRVDREFWAWQERISG